MFTAPHKPFPHLPSARVRAWRDHTCARNKAGGGAGHLPFARLPTAMEMKPLRASPSDEAASAAASALPEGWLLVKELGVNNLIEELYPDERLARETAARLWCSWVLFHMPAAGASLVELAAGGLGFGHESIRRHVSFEFASVHPLSLFMQNNLNALNLESIASLEHLAPSAAACAPPALRPPPPPLQLPLR